MPISPPPSHNGDVSHHGLQLVAQHNATCPYPQEQYHDEQYPEESLTLHLNYLSSSAGGDEAYSYRGQQSRFAYQQYQHQDSNLGVHYDDYNAEHQGLLYPNHYGTPVTSPPIASMNTQDRMRTRSGLSVPRALQNLKPMPEGRPRVDKSLKVKKAKKEKLKVEKKVAKLEKPLSELTKDWKHVPVADIEAYVNRSVQERRREVEESKTPGKVKRPMNSFMLYRKAYQNRTKDWCLQNNHQIVSQVCGDSWPLEPETVKKQFTEWARIERVNHQNAHPGYKFSPTKPAVVKATKRKMSEEPISDESDLDDYEWQGGPSRKKKKPRSNPRQPPPQKTVAYPTTRSAYDYSSRDNSTEPNHTSYNKSSYQATNPGRPLPPQYSQEDLHAGQYYQQTIQHNSPIPGVEDVIIRKQAAPGSQSYLGLPGGGQNYDVMNPYPQYEGQLQGQEHRIDPSLIAVDRGVYDDRPYEEDLHPDGVYFGASHDSDLPWQGQYGIIDRDLSERSMLYLDITPGEENMAIQDHHAHILRGHQEGWHVESLDASQEFDKWMDEE